MKEYKMKCVILGDSAVGKTSIIQHFLIGYFDERIDSTIGASFVSKLFVNKEENETVKFQVWDTAGQERYSSLVPLYFRDAAMAIIMIDITSRFSLDSAKRWIEYLHQKHQDLSYLVVATKLDLIEQRTVYQDDLDKLPAPLRAPLSVSSLDATNFPDLRIVLEELLGCEREATPPPPKTPQSFNLYRPSKYPPSKCC